LCRCTRYLEARRKPAPDADQLIDQMLRYTAKNGAVLKPCLDDLSLELTYSKQPSYFVAHLLLLDNRSHRDFRVRRLSIDLVTMLLMSRPEEEFIPILPSLCEVLSELLFDRESVSVYTRSNIILSFSVRHVCNQAGFVSVRFCIEIGSYKSILYSC